MRLLNAKTLELAQFAGEIPPYAILSHTWGAEEVSFSDITSPERDKKKGYAKILGCCRQALMDTLEWVWVDTCCIDKTSSAELSEAINSMFAWYQGAQVCYVHLEDVLASHPGFVFPEQEFRAARWFTRGWCLQELIAPATLEFYTADWHNIGSKFSLCGLIEEIATIPGRAGPEAFQFESREMYLAMAPSAVLPLFSVVPSSAGEAAGIDVVLSCSKTAAITIRGTTPLLPLRLMSSDATTDKPVTQGSTQFWRAKDSTGSLQLPISLTLLFSLDGKTGAADFPSSQQAVEVDLAVVRRIMHPLRWTCTIKEDHSLQDKRMVTDVPTILKHPVASDRSVLTLRNGDTAVAVIKHVLPSKTSKPFVEKSTRPPTTS
ncbi:HET-domain-containing protein [Parathielavia appendiculata]|uniref:HET-domain-containing protein n=1 Tax=Parathielavia appendiculata TaxID=2587402 RepID=A0AAN6U613_9PEZI|nr:HET-domain-containing protein [Parathielavia appendiculata]